MKQLITLIVIIGLIGCSTEPSIPKAKKQEINHNYIIVLDLSDRILVENQISRDIDLINHLYSTFLQKVQKSFFINSKDNFKVVLPYQKEALPTSKISILEDELYISMESIPLREKKNIRDSKEQFDANINELYKLAKFSDDPNDYKGSDIHGYLRDNLKLDLINEVNTENKIFILTDGYMYIEGKSPGIDTWDRVTDLSNAEVAILEINPSKKRDNELSRIENAWNSWMKSMNAKETMIMPIAAMSKVKESISQFIFKKKIAPITNASALVSSPAKEKVTEQKITENKLESNSDLLVGNYYGNVDGKLRTISITSLNIIDNQGSFTFSYKPFGTNFENLTGSLSNKSVTLDKVGDFQLVDSQDYLILKNNKDGNEFKLLKD